MSAVRASTRLADSAVCLVAADAAPDRQFERLVTRHQPGGARTAPVLELNPAHTLIRQLAERATSGGDPAVLTDAAYMLLGQARILDGEPPDDPVDFTARIARLLEERLH